jgi:hypothetical protein
VQRAVLPLIAVGILAACGSAAGDGDDQVASPAATSAPAVTTTEGLPTPATSSDSAAPVSVPEALGFTASLVGGGDIELTTLAGRPVLLWFWAPW